MKGAVFHLILQHKSREIWRKIDALSPPGRQSFVLASWRIPTQRENLGINSREFRCKKYQFNSQIVSFQAINSQAIQTSQVSKQEDAKHVQKSGHSSVVTVSQLR